MTQIFLTFLLAGAIANANALTPSHGNSTVVLQGSDSWLKVQGDSAKALYLALTVPAKSNQGEAGDGLTFKFGKSYRCYVEERSQAYACDVMIQNPSTGDVKGF